MFMLFQVLQCPYFLFLSFFAPKVHPVRDAGPFALLHETPHDF